MNATSRQRNLLLAPALLALALLVPAQASAHDPGYVPGELVVGLEGGGFRVVELEPGEALDEVARELEARAEIRFAEPNWIATAAAVNPLDRGSSGKPGGWRIEQWSFLGKPGGIRVAGAWKRLEAAGAPGGFGVRVAVVDTGIAFTNGDRMAASPDFAPAQFVPGPDFVGNDGIPADENGHGTHVAGTIAEQITVGVPASSADYLTGIAYGAQLMPVRALDAAGTGSASDVARGIAWAARHGADVINVSLQFSADVKRCGQVPAVCDAVRTAKRNGALVVAAAGNNYEGGSARALFPAAAPGVLAVGATTEHGCLAAYSHYGRRTDLLAPGGGRPRSEAAMPACEGDTAQIRQLTLECFPIGPCASYDQFAIRPDLGSSMSAAHVSGVAALVRASGLLGRNPSAGRLARRLECTAREQEPRRFYGTGLLDARRALTARIDCAQADG
jgi:serine protease